jgi:hypothetical protein
VAPDDLELAADRAALAAILEARGRSREARETLRDVLSTLEAVLGPDHYEVGLTLSELGDMHISAGHFGDAHTALTRATGIFERVLGGSHPSTAACRARREQALARMDEHGG